MNTQQILKHFSNHFIFRILHYCFIALQLRDELTKTTMSGVKYPRSSFESQPFVLWLTNLLLTFAGDILVNLLLGTLPLEPFSNFQDILLCTVAWYFIFYCPFDVAHTVANTVGFRILATPVTAISQVLHIDRGVHLAGKVYGNNAMIPILIIGTVIGSGAEFLKPVAALLINRCQANNSAYVKLSTNSKVALCISSFYLLHLNESLCLSRRQLQEYALLSLITFKYLCLAYRMDHFIWKLERQLCYAFFGGLFADLTKFFKRRTVPSARKSFSKFD